MLSYFVYSRNSCRRSLFDRMHGGLSTLERSQFCVAPKSFTILFQDCSCGNIQYFWLVSRKASGFVHIWINELKWYRVRILLGSVHILLWRIQCWHSLVKQFGIRDSGQRKNARVRLHQLARPIEVLVFRVVFGYCIDKTFVDAVRLLSVGICFTVTMNICK